MRIKIRLSGGTVVTMTFMCLSGQPLHNSPFRNPSRLAPPPASLLPPLITEADTCKSEILTTPYYCDDSSLLMIITGADCTDC